MADYLGMVKALVKTLTDEPSILWRSAAAVLGQLGAAAVLTHPGVVMALVGLLEDRDRDVRRSAAKALGELGAAAMSSLRISADGAPSAAPPPPMQPAGPSELHAMHDFEHVRPLPESERGECNLGMDVVRCRRGGTAGCLYVRKRTSRYDMYDREITRLEAINGSGLLDEGERGLFCRLLAWHTTGHEYVLVMEHCEGGDLGQLLERRSSAAELPLATILRWSESMACALFVLHHKLRRLHLDFNPANLLLTGVGARRAEIKVADFGTSQVCRKDQDDGQEGEVGEVEQPMTCDFISAPEQGMERFVSPATDRYQLGLVLLQLLCRRRLEDMESDAMTSLLAARTSLKEDITRRGYGDCIFSALPLDLQARWRPIGPSEAEAEMDLLQSQGQPLRQLVLDLLRPQATERPGDRDVIRRVRAARATEDTEGEEEEEEAEDREREQEREQ